MFTRNRFFDSFIAAATLVVMTPAFAGCGAGAAGDSAGASAEVSTQQAAFDGETTFRGFFFGTGAVAERLPMLWDNATVKARAASIGAESPQTRADAVDAAADKMQADGWSAHSVATMKQLADDVRTGRSVEPTAEQQAAMQDLLVGRIRAADPTFFDRHGAAMQSGDPVRIDRTLEEASRLLRAALDVSPTGSGSHGPISTELSPTVYVQVLAATRYVVAAIVFVAAIIIFSAPEPGSPKHGSLAREELVNHVARALAIE